RGSGTALGIAAWASARAGLALARGDDELALRAAQTVRDTGREEALSRLGFCPWPLLEAEALIAQGRTAEARVRLKASGYPAPDRPGMTSSAHREPSGELARDDSGPDGTAGTGLAQPGMRGGEVSAELGTTSSAYGEPGGELVGSPRSHGLGARLDGIREEGRAVRQGSEVRRFTAELTALRLYGLLAADNGDGAAAAAMFAAGRSEPRAEVVPYQLAQLELAAGR